MTIEPASASLFPNSPPLDARSRELRRMVIEAMDGGERGHLGSSMSLIEIMRVLYDDIARHRPDDPAWSGRDRIILSKGHGCLALYALLADHSYFPRSELKTFCHQTSFLGGHPERGKVPGVEASMWIGGRLRNDGRWTWENGGGAFPPSSSDGYANWGDGPPDGSTGECVYLNSTNGTWRAQNCDTTSYRYFLCQGAH